MATMPVLDNPGVNYCKFIVSPVFPTCPVTGEPYAVDVTVKYHPAGCVIEYIEFEDWIHALVAMRPLAPEELGGMTLEDVAAVVLARAKALLGEGVPIGVTACILASKHCWATVTAQTENWRKND